MVWIPIKLQPDNEKDMGLITDFNTHSRLWHHGRTGCSLPTCMSELEVALKHTSTDNARGTDEIPADLFKCDNCLLPHLYNLLCFSWRGGKFPTAMKVAKIMTLLKKGDKCDCNNYRSWNFTVKCDRQGLCESATTKTPKTCRPHLPRISMWFSQWTFNNGYDIFSFRQIQQKCREQIKEYLST